ncbi:MAG: hypothetical protein J6B16_01645 [Clostridia bacterium]|nr:hypothetical protein [Clostridia bacterium]
MENNNKIATYIGFSIRSRNCKMGVNAVATLKRADLVMVCHSASDNTKKDAVKLATRFRTKLIISRKILLSDLTHKDNCKVLAITDKSLAKAILDNLNDDFTEYSMEANNG